jgi:hypothetical protein
METPEQILMNEVSTELARARSLFKPIYSPHEALGIIREEYIEFEQEVFKFNLAKGRDTRPAMRTELVQLATMALRSVLDALEFDPTAEPDLGVADVWHQGSRSYYRAQLLKKLTPEEAEFDPTEENHTGWTTPDDKAIRRIKDVMQYLEAKD